jgi:hypothetical protein
MFGSDNRNIQNYYHIKKFAAGEHLHILLCTL